MKKENRAELRASEDDDADDRHYVVYDYKDYAIMDCCGGFFGDKQSKKPSLSADNGVNHVVPAAPSSSAAAVNHAVAAPAASDASSTSNKSHGNGGVGGGGNGTGGAVTPVFHAVSPQKGTAAAPVPAATPAAAAQQPAQQQVRKA